VIEFRRFLSLISGSVVTQLHQHSLLRVTLHSLYMYLDNFGLECFLFLKSVDKGMITLLCVLLMCRALQLLNIVYSRQCFIFILLESQADSMLLSI